MHATITNTSKAAQGVWTKDDGLQFIEPGKSRPLTIADDYVERVKALPFLTIGDPDAPDRVARYASALPVQAHILEFSADGAITAAQLRNALDHDGDGKKGGVANSAPLTDAEEAELVDAMTDDELRDFIERKTGKKPHHKAGHDKLVTLAKEAAKI